MQPGVYSIEVPAGGVGGAGADDDGADGGDATILGPNNFEANRQRWWWWIRMDQLLTLVVVVVVLQVLDQILEAALFKQQLHRILVLVAAVSLHMDLLVVILQEELHTWRWWRWH